MFREPKTSDLVHTISSQYTQSDTEKPERTAVNHKPHLSIPHSHHKCEGTF